MISGNNTCRLTWPVVIKSFARALACIIYELYVGEPPFYADGLYRLIDMVVHNPVCWPTDFPPVLRDFLERLLVKNPRRRLCWPELLDHPYIKDHVKGEMHVQDAKFCKHLASAMTPSVMLTCRCSLTL
jgi:serine/threonine protein kinase